MRKVLLFLSAILALSASALTYNVEVPAGTKACYIAGNMNNWSHQEMTKVDATHYTIDIAGASESDKYKYSSRILSSPPGADGADVLYCPPAEHAESGRGRDA